MFKSDFFMNWFDKEEPAKLERTKTWYQYLDAAVALTKVNNITIFIRENLQNQTT